jgi:hypothetical protein
MSDAATSDGSRSGRGGRLRRADRGLLLGDETITDPERRLRAEMRFLQAEASGDFVND